MCIFLHHNRPNILVLNERTLKVNLNIFQRIPFIFRRMKFGKPSSHITLMWDYTAHCFISLLDTFEKSAKYMECSDTAFLLLLYIDLRSVYDAITDDNKRAQEQSLYIYEILESFHFAFLCRTVPWILSNRNLWCHRSFTHLYWYNICLNLLTILFRICQIWEQTNVFHLQFQKTGKTHISKLLNRY